MKLTLALCAAAFIAVIARADTLVTTDGSTIKGKILVIDAELITIETDFAGKLEIDQEDVASISTDEPRFLKLASGATYLGPIESTESGLMVNSDSGRLPATMETIDEVWFPGDLSPSEKDLTRNWEYEAAFDLTGKTGNSDSTGLAAAFLATLEGVDDRLRFSGRANFEDTDGVKSADDARAGVDYKNNFSDRYSWYTRTAFGYDSVKDIETYFTVAAGAGYDIYDTDKHKMSVRAGLGYLFEAYDGNREDQSSASLDLGFDNKIDFSWGTMRNIVIYTPTISDFSNFRVFHDSSIELPLKAEGWSIRTGMYNDYDSEAELSGKDELDTTYYVRMVLRWP